MKFDRHLAAQTSVESQSDRSSLTTSFVDSKLCVILLINITVWISQGFLRISSVVYNWYGISSWKSLNNALCCKFNFILILFRIAQVVDPLIMIFIVATLFTDRLGPEVLGNISPRQLLRKWHFSNCMPPHRRWSSCTLIPTWISNHTPCKVWDKIIYPFPNVWEWISNVIPNTGCNCLSMLGSKWNHVNIRGPRDICHCHNLSEIKTMLSDTLIVKFIIMHSWYNAIVYNTVFTPGHNFDAVTLIRFRTPEIYTTSHHHGRAMVILLWGEIWLQDT